MFLIFLFFALAAGLMIGIHGVINSSGAKAVGLPTMLAFFSIVQAIPALIYIFIMKPSLGIVGSFSEGWKWFLVAGLMAAAIVTVMTLSISKIGALTAFALVILGQIIASAIADHFGLLGIEVKPMSMMKVASIFVIIGGVLLLVKSNSANNETESSFVKSSTVIRKSRKIS
ncbi:DMT family transporter [Paenibacillus alkaliterrae]|uniref:DMT family transporter n=1 Tax=Paenibacillus alkaliterrae TaxID=320909 RepID=UPI001F45AADA|nr:DMT family transporter [Paenibacillus alkaliterrae]MCF2940010.1 DMT family transporter [Paenibacillus alkaliterrae]